MYSFKTSELKYHIANIHDEHGIDYRTIDLKIQTIEHPSWQNNVKLNVCVYVCAKSKQKKDDAVMK